MNVWEVFHHLLIGDGDVDLLCNIEIPIQIEIDLGLFGEMEIQVAREEEDTRDNQDDEKGDLGLQPEDLS